MTNNRHNSKDFSPHHSPTSSLWNLTYMLDNMPHLLSWYFYSNITSMRRWHNYRVEVLSTRRLHSTDSLLDTHGILRVGGRLDCSQYLEFEETHPAIPQKLISATHWYINTTGRKSTLDQLHLKGYWVIGGHSSASSMIRKCTICIKLPAKTTGQQKAPPPEKRTQPSPPFTYSGFDIFGNLWFKIEAQK
mgnify:CR=1 FL=1